MPITCFDKFMPELSAPFKERVKGMSDAEQRAEAIKLVLETHKELHGELQAFKKSISAKGETYVPFDFDKSAKEINLKYKNQKNESKNKSNGKILLERISESRNQDKGRQDSKQLQKEMKAKYDFIDLNLLSKFDNSKSYLDELEAMKVIKIKC